MQIKQVRIYRVKFNAGSLPAFTGEINEAGQRTIEYRDDHWIENFPLIWSGSRQFDAMEMNLFLEHRYKGIYRAPKRSGHSNSLGGVSVKTLSSIANSLSLFLSWLENMNVDWRHVTAEANTQRAKYWLPVYRFRKHLIDLTREKSLGRDSANLYMTHVRQFYEWARRRDAVDKLPFEYKQVQIKHSSSSEDINLLFSLPFVSKGLSVQTSDLVIPKKYRQKTLPSDQLSPFSQEELSQLYGSEYVQSPSRRLWIDLALLTGMRAFEIAGFKASHVVNPSENVVSSYYASIIGKGNKERQILIPAVLMQRLWRYKNSTGRLQRVAKWEAHTGADSETPLFLNRSGKPIAEKSVCNIAAFARKELLERGVVLKRSFHDLRATYATNLAKFMLDKELEPGLIEYKLMALLGHSNFSTTRKYLNFARSITFDSEMQGWSNTVFDGIDAALLKGYEHLKEARHLD